MDAPAPSSPRNGNTQARLARLDETARLEALKRYDLLDTPAETEFDDFTWLASQICCTPIALISLLDAGRQWFKSKVGLEVSETPREVAFCDYAIRGTEILVVPNAPADARFSHNPLVTGAPDIRFYAGMPLTTPDGFQLGTLCVIDRVPRKLSLEQLGSLERLGRQVMAQMEFRRALVEQRRAERHLILQNAVSRTLLQSVGHSQLAPTLLETICVCLGLKIGVIWKLDPKAQELRCMDFWNETDVGMYDFEESTRETAFERGAGMPGRVWESGHSCWASDIGANPDGPRAAIALSAGLRSCIGAPILSGQHCLGVIEFFGVEVAPPDKKVLDVIHAIGRQLGQFLQRKEDEAKIHRIQRALQQSNRELERRNAEIKSFYHTLSHELKTPLTSAREFVSIVIDGLAGPLSPEQREYLGLAKESCDQLRVYINDLLDVTRLETGKLTLQLKQCAPNLLAQRIVQLMEPAATRKGIDLQAETAPDVAEATLDESRIIQVLTNLLTNAIKFTDAGGTIGVRIRNAPHRPNYLRISVSDTGRGIPAEQQEDIFDRLYQIREGDSVTAGGLGLGLYICREVVELHRGTIWVESVPGEGSTFHIDLPTSQESSQPRVLIVDDDLGIRTIHSAQLEREHFIATSVASGAEALQEMRRQRPDVVLLDLQMPGMSGAETLREIRKTWRDLPVILHTGYPDSDSIMQALKESPFKVLAKPSTGKEVLEAVRAAISFAQVHQN